MTISNYTVTGMTCDHCVRSVSEEVSAIPGVTDLEIDLATGALTVTTADAPVSDDAVREAVAESGYTVTT